MLPFSSKVIAETALQPHLTLNQKNVPVEDALTIVRMFNTLEAWHKLRNETYESKLKLWEWAELGKQFNTKNAKLHEKAKKWKDLYDQIDIQSDNILPGWRFSLRLSRSRDAYLLSLRSIDTMFVTDESGIIYQGNSLADAKFPETYIPLQKILSPSFSPISREIDQPKTFRSKAASLIKRAAFATMPYGP